MYKVQSVLFNKSKFSLYLCKQWLKEHQYKDKDLDDKTNFYHFRQYNPTSLKKQGYTEFRTKKLGKSGIELIIVYKPQKSGGKISNDDLHHFIHASYKQGESYKGWKLDSSLSDASVQVYWNGKDAVVVHRGSQDAQDWYENGRQILGMNTGKRLEHSRGIQKEAERKYGANNVITIGYSKGAHHAEEVGQDSREIYTLNKLVTPSDLFKGKKVSEKQTDIRTTLDPVSILRPLQQGSDYQNIWSKTLNPLTEHMGSVLNRVNPAKWWGKGLDGGRCWKGYEPVPGRQPYSKGSCRKISGNTIMKKRLVGGEITRDDIVRIIPKMTRDIHSGRKPDDKVIRSIDRVIRWFKEHEYDDAIYIPFIQLLRLILELPHVNNNLTDLVMEALHYFGENLEGGGAGASIMERRTTRWNEVYNDTLNRVENLRHEATPEDEAFFAGVLLYLSQNAGTTEEFNRMIRLYEIHFIANPFFSFRFRNRLRNIYFRLHGGGTCRSAPVVPMSVEERFDEDVENLREYFRIPYQHRGRFNHQQIIEITHILDRIVGLINNHINEIGIFNLNTLTNLFERSVNNNPHVPIHLRTLTTNITLGMRNHFPANYEEGKQNERTLSEHPHGAGFSCKGRELGLSYC